MTVLLTLSAAAAQRQNNPIDDSYLWGREYFVLRSGQTQMILQSDKTHLMPAFTYLLFNADVPKQSNRKSYAFNYVEETKYLSSALEVVMRNHAFTAFGHTTSTGWVIEEGAPAVEACWWAGGFTVREVISPQTMDGVFCRKITLQSRDMAATDTITLRLSLPGWNGYFDYRTLFFSNHGACLALTAETDYPIRLEENTLNIGPIVLAPGESITIPTFLLINIPDDHAQLNQKYLQFSQQRKAGEATNTAQQWMHSNTIATSDKLVQRFFDNSRYLLPGYISDNGIMNSGIFQYSGQWIRDMSMIAMGFVYSGEFERARVMLEHMLRDMITENGTTMISGAFDIPEREQFDQGGELMYALKCYYNWTGDASLLETYGEKIITMVDRPLLPLFRDTETGMIHNRREYWERSLKDAYELIYQIWQVVALREAADLSAYLGASSQKAATWRREADVILNATLNHPQYSLVANGHLIKRRNLTGEIADTIQQIGLQPGAPSGLEYKTLAYPDASMALPIALEVIDPSSELSVNTLQELETLWNQRWSCGGYGRYSQSSEPYQPGPWPFATEFILRAQHEARQMDQSRRSLEWLGKGEVGGRTGVYFEEIPILRATPQDCGLLSWANAELLHFIVYHLMGVKFTSDGQMMIKPFLYENTAPLKADLRYKENRFRLEIHCPRKASYALVNGQRIAADDQGCIVIPRNFTSGDIQVY